LKRPATYGLIAGLAAAVIIAAGWGAAWVAGTTDGLRWLMETVSRHTPLAISAQKVEGKLLDHLQLAGIRVALGPVEVGMESVDFHWAPLNLLSGRVAMKELTLTGVQIRDNTPGKTPPDLAWPKISGLAASFDGWIERLQVSDLTYRRLGGLPLNITTLSSSVTWKNTLLSLSDFTVVAPSGRVTGSIAAGLSLPSLQLDLAATLAVPVAGMDAISLQGRFLPGQGSEQLAGRFTVVGSSGSMKRLEFAGEAGMTGKAFHLRQLRLTVPGRPGTVTGGGTVTLTAREPQLELKLAAAGLDLSPELNVPTDLSGTLTLTGNPGLYRGDFTFSNHGKGWRTATLSGKYQGDRGGVKLAPLSGSLLAGSLRGSLDLRWRDKISAEGTIRGRDLNPAGIDPDWAGVVNFDLSGNGAWSGQTPPTGKLRGMLLESRLHGQALTGAIQAEFAGGDLRIDRLALRGKGFTIQAEGELGKRLAFDAQVGDLSRLVPTAKGELRADGWVRWRGGRLDGSMTGQGKHLAANVMRVAAVNLSARLGEGKGYPLHVAATLSKAAYEDFQADSVTLEADGSALRHTVNAAFQSAGAEARVSLSGEYNRGNWQGKIVRFAGRDRVGPWNLAAPAALSFATGQITLAPLVITGVQPERLEIAGELTRKPLAGSVRAAWNGLNLARMNPWLTLVRATGASAGDIQLRFSEGEKPLFSGNARAVGAVTAEKYGIAIQQGSLRLDGNEKGIHVETELRPTDGGVLKGSFSSPAPARLTIPETVQGTAEWTDIDLAPLRRWLPGGFTVAGRLTGQVTGNLLAGERLNLTGKASLPGGKIRWQKGNEEIDVALHVAELSVGWQGALPASVAEIGTGRLVVAGRAGASGVLTLDGHPIGVEQATLSLEGNERGMNANIDISLAGGGSLKGRFSSEKPAVLPIPDEGKVSLEWTGVDLSLVRPWLPRTVNLEGHFAGRAEGNLLPKRRLEMKGDAALSGGKIRWQQGNEAIDATLRTAELSVGWQGALPASVAEIGAGRLVVAGRFGASGVLTLDGRPIGVEQGSLSLEGNERGMSANIGISLAGGGSLKGGFSSAKPARLSIPDEGKASLEWAGVDLLPFRPWLPRTVNLEGHFAGRAEGNLLPERRFAMKGDATLSGGKVSWRRPEGEINSELSSASVSWEWRGEAIHGTAVLALAEQGEAKGSFRVPIPARLPVAFDRKGPLQASLAGQVRENGLLTALFPGFIQASRGELHAELRVNGTWEAPKIEGTLKLDGAGAYLPTAGIHVKDIRFAMRLEKDLVRIDSFRAASGPGHIEGTATVRLKGWRIAGYEGSINGERFQTVYLPELQILAAPRLTFEGTPEKLAIRGEVRLPELLISGPPTRAIVLPSRDVILVEAPIPAEKTFPLVLDVQVRITLGEKVLVKVEGIDAQLGGSIDLVFRSLDQITSKGEIRVVKGRYRAFGADLEIVRGRLFYAGGPINQPTLDILALRTVGDVRAGITAGGILRAPVIKLYSLPAMPDVDILAYILFGHPFGTSNSIEQAGMMAQVASALLSRGQSVPLQEQIKNRLGLSTLEIETTRETPGRSGYKPIPVAPAGVAPASQTAGISQTMLTVGKYLTPQLYFSYGRSLFTGGNLFRLRYDIFKQWQIETQTGSESGVDLYYKIEFN